MTVDQVEVKGGSDLDVAAKSRRNATSDRRLVLILIGLATVFGLLAAVAFMVLASAVVGLVAADQPQPVKVAIIAVATAVGAAGAGWAAQPLLARLAIRLAGYRLGRS